MTTGSRFFLFVCLFFSYIHLNLFLKLWLLSTPNTLSLVPSTPCCFLWGTGSTVFFLIPLNHFLNFFIPGASLCSISTSRFSNVISSFIFAFQLINQLRNSILNPWWLLSWVSKNLKILSVESIIEFGCRSSLPPLCLNHIETMGQVWLPQI